MASTAFQKKTYFLVPGWDIPPGVIKLGNIISDPTAPHWPIQGDVMSLEDTVQKSRVQGFSASISNQKATKFGLWAQFLQVFGLGGEASIQHSREKLDIYAFDELLTEWFQPSETFVRNAISTNIVQDFCKMQGKRTPVYMVTGIKTIPGAHITTTTDKTGGYSGKIGFDGTLVGVPVTIGPHVDYGKGHGQVMSWKCDGPLVFAFQLHQIKVRRDKEASLKAYNRGGMFEDAESHQKSLVLIEFEQAPFSLYSNAVDEGLEWSEFVKIDEAAEEDSGELCAIIIPLEG